MRVLIAGAGRAGLAVAVHLQSSGHQVTLIDHEAALARKASEQHGLVALAGDATDADTLDAAEVGRADVVVSMLRRDADNLAVALLARSAGAPRLMVRMRDAAYRPVYKAAGVHRVLSELDVFVGAFGTAIEHEAVRHALIVGYGQGIAFELLVPPDAFIIGRTIDELSADPAFPEDCVVAGLFPPGAPSRRVRGASVIEAGMAILLVAPRAAVTAAVRFFMRPAA